MYNELKIKLSGKVSLDLTLEEQHALLVELEERIGSLLEAYSVKDIKYDTMISKVIFIDDSWEA